MDITTASEAVSTGSIPVGRTILFLLLLSLAGCAATRAWYDEQRGYMSAEDAAARGYPDCVGLTIAQCGAKHAPAKK